MRLSFKVIAFVIATALGTVIAAPQGFAQEKPAAADPADLSARERAAHDLLVEMVPLSRLPEIYGDLRSTARNVYLPVLRDSASGQIPGVPAPDPQTADALAKFLTFLTYAVRASDELDPNAQSLREEFIADVAALLAKQYSSAEIATMRDVLRMPATRKGFDTTYAFSRLMTDVTYEEWREARELTAWIETLKFENGVPQDQPAPSPAKLAKAQMVVNELVRVSGIDDMIADMARFAREVLLKVAPMTDEERSQYSMQLEQLEFTYNVQKAVLIAAAPAGLATFVTDEQLEKLNRFVHSPACTKMFRRLHEFVRAATALTTPEILAVRETVESAQRQGQFRQRSPEEQTQAEADWKALHQKWSDRLNNSLSPETREGVRLDLDPAMLQFGIPDVRPVPQEDSPVPQDDSKME